MLTTSDIGFAIRDFLEDRVINHIDRDTTETFEGPECEYVDVFNPDNPVILMSNGQQFQVRIFAA